MAADDSQQTGSHGQDVPIAVIGYGIRFPGDATSPEKFYQMLSEGRDAWTETPPSRYNVDAYWHPSSERIGTTSARGAHYVEQDPSVFDAPFFSMTGAEAAAIDPALRMMLEVVYECLEDSGIPMQSVVGSDTSVFVGTSSSEYHDLALSDIENVPLYAAVGIGNCMLGNRLSHFYDLRGTSQTIDTACSATMVAMHQACNSLRTGEARMSLVAGSQLMMGAGGNVSLTRLGFLSPDGRCYTFDERANGYSRGEGVGCLAIKRLDDAIADGDTIRAVVRATGSNQDGKTPGIVQPSAKAQSDLIKQVYRAAKLNPDDTQYFEAHGTGTTLGDPLEVNALVEAMATKNRAEDNPMYIGSVKTNVGHLEGSAGLAGLFKAILQLEHGQLFPTLNFKKPNPRLKLDDWHLKLPLETIPWPGKGQRRISINSFGYGGTNAHCILDDAYNYLKSHGLKGMTATVAVPPGLPRRSIDSEGNDSAMGSETITPENEADSGLPKLFVFSSPEQAAVDRMTTRYAEWLKRESKAIGKEDINLSDLAFTLGQRRSMFQWRYPVVARTADELQETLAKQTKSTRAGQVPNLLWVFTGQGAQHAAMGKELLQYQAFRESIEAAQLFFHESLKADWDVVEELTRSGQESRINEAEFSQPLCTVVQVALVDLLTSWKVQPQAVVGHSSGEIGAAYAAGALSAADAWRVAFHRGRLSSNITKEAPELDGSMGMMAVGKPAEEIEHLIPGADAEEPVVAACYNSPQNVTLSGNKPVLAELEQKLKDDDVFARQLKVDIAYHSPYMKVIADQYQEAIKDIKPMAGNKEITMLSTVTGQQIEASELDASYWVKNMCSPVRFVEGIQAAFPKQKTLSRRKKREGLAIDGLLEIGPHSALQGPIRQILTEEKKSEEVFYASMLSRGKDAIVTSLEAAGMLWSKGLPLDLERVNNSLIDAPQGKVLAGLPSYSWNHANSFWFEHKAESRRKRVGYRHDFVGARLEPHLGLRWRNWLRPKENPWLMDFKIDEDAVLSPQTLMVSILEAGRQMAESSGNESHGFTLSDVKFGTPVVIPELGTDIYTDLRPLGKMDAGADADAEKYPEYEFDIFTDPKDVPIYHCQGKLKIHYEQDAPVIQKDTRFEEDIATAVERTAEDFYSHWDDQKIHWGPQSQLIKELVSSPNSSKIALELKETKKAMPLEYEYPHLVHPTTLNACFQGVYAAFGSEAAWPETQSIDSVYISNSFPKGEGVQLTADSDISYQGFGSYAGEVVVKDKAGRVQVAAQGVNLQTEMLKNVAEEKLPSDVKKVASNFYWKPDPAKLTPEKASTVFNEKELILESPQKPVFPGTGSLCHKQQSAVPDTVPWKAFTSKWLELCGHKKPTQTVVEAAHSADDFALKALEVLGGQFGATPVCSKYLCAVQEALPEGSTQFQDWSHFFSTKQLDLKTESNVQEPEAATVDTFIISERLAGLNDVEILLKNAENALKPGGWLVMSQVDVPDSKADLEAVSLQLQERGFTGVKFSLRSSASDANTRVLISQKPERPTLEVDRAVFVLPEEVSEDLQKFVELLKDGFAKMDVAVEVSTWNKVTADTSIIKNQAVVNLLEAETPFIWQINEEQYEQVRAFLLNGHNGGLWLNKGNCNLEPESDFKFHSATGLLRVMRNEEEKKFTELSLSHHEPLARQLAVDHTLQCFRDVYEAESLEKTAETEVGELNGVLHICRIYDEPIKNRQMQMIGKQPPPKQVTLGEQDRPLRLTIDDPTNLGSLKFVDDSENQGDLGDSQVQVEIQAHGVRSMHDIRSLGLMETNLGTCAAGTIKQVGSKVSQFKAGDSVAFFGPGAYRTRMQVDEDAVLPIPDSMPASTAATFVENLLLAYYAIFEICRLRPRDPILVTSAETGLGQQIVQLAGHVGAKLLLLTTDEESKEKAVADYGLQPEQVFATNSHSLAQNIRNATGGEGVDFLFRTSSDSAAYIASKAISRMGKIFEFDGSGASTQDLNKIERHLLKDTTVVKYLAKQAGNLVKAGIVSRAAPAQVYGYSDMKQAFEAAAAQKGNADIALELRPDDVIPAVPGKSHELQCRPDSTYVIVGGLGGVGRWLSVQLAQRGARYIATLSRSGAKKQEAKDTLKQLADMGVDARAYICDIGNSDSFQSALEQVNSEMPPVKGAVHAAMVIQDSYLSEMPWQGWNDVSRNKVQGGLNMHNFLPKDMDFLVFISSLSVVMGQAMQANYASGNCMLDGLTWHRRNLGMNCSVVNFGLIAGIGFVAELQSFNDKDADFEKYSIPPHEVWSILESAMTNQIEDGVPTGPQQLTCCMSGGIFESLTTLQTFVHLGDPKFAFISHLDRKGEASDGGVDSIKKGRKALENALNNAESWNAAVAAVEEQMVEKVASAIPMPPEDVDPSRPMGHYGVDSLIASEVRNWAFNVVKGTLHAAEILAAPSIDELAAKLASRSGLVPDHLKEGN